MPSTPNFCRGKKRLQSLVKFAQREGWDVSRTGGGHLKFTKHGQAPIYTSLSASDHRATQNARARFLRAAREATDREK